MENSDEINNNIHTELGRDLGLPSALAIGVGTMIAAGIFTLSGLAVRNVGSAAILSFLLAAVVAIFTALTYCEFVSIYPESGEGYFYARKTFSSPLAFFVGWALFLGYTSSCGFYLSSLSSYYNEFIREMPLESLSGLVILYSPSEGSLYIWFWNGNKVLYAFGMLILPISLANRFPYLVSLVSEAKKSLMFRDISLRVWDAK